MTEVTIENLLDELTKNEIDELSLSYGLKYDSITIRIRKGNLKNNREISRTMLSSSKDMNFVFYFVITDMLDELIKLEKTQSEVISYG